MRISGNSNAGSIAGAIAGLIRNSEPAELEMIGATAVYKGIYAASIASKFLAEEGTSIVLRLREENRMVNEIPHKTFVISVFKDSTNG